MEQELAYRLAAMNRGFYDAHAEAFSATRRSSWAGWERAVDAAGLLPAAPGPALRVLDVACGNLRFERFLGEALPGRAIEAVCVDACEPLVASAEALPQNVQARFVCSDIVGALLAGDALPWDDGAFDLVACFGFFHHVPGGNARERLMRGLARAAAPGGHVVASFWRFAQDEGLHEKAIGSTERIRADLGLPDLDPGDYLLGWQGDESRPRYCHSFEDGEVEAFAACLPGGVRIADVFDADGRTGALNRYLAIAVEALDISGR